MDSIFYSACLAFLSIVICEDPDAKLRGFELNAAKNNSCFKIYNSTDQVDDSTCQKSFKKGKTSCALALADDENHCEIRTPSNESIIVKCYVADTTYTSDPNQKYYGTNSISQNEIMCYMVRKGSKVQEVCTKLIDTDTAAITTPDNYTLIIKSKDCSTGKWLATINANRQFAVDFTFDPNERSCYKLFTPDEDISDLTCFEEIESPKACVHGWDKNPNCTVLITPNNETIVVDCMGGTNATKNCVEVYNDDQSTEICMEELSEGCMGITTSSGLRLLFACRICRSKYSDIHIYDKAALKNQRQFVKKLLENGQYYKHKFDVWNDDYRKNFNSRQSVYPHWLPNTKCYGLKLDTNETLIVQCTERKFERNGCFKIIGPNETVESDVCAAVHKEKCVIIDTPKGKRIFLGCYDALEYESKKFLDTIITKYKNGNYPFLNTAEYMIMYRHHANCRKEKVPYNVGWLNNHNCSGIVTNDLEVIPLKCPYDKEKIMAGCFPIYSQNYGPDGQILPSSYTVHKACANIIDESCVGIITPKGWAVQLDCYVSIRGAYGGGVFSVKRKEPTDLF